MRKFFTRLLQFAVFFPLMLLVASLGILRDRYVAEKSSFATDKKIVICGNSLPETAVDDDLCKGVLNWADQGEWACKTYIKFRRFMPDNGEVKLVLWGVGQAFETDSLFESAETIFGFGKIFHLFQAEDAELLFRVKSGALSVGAGEAVRLGFSRFFEKENGTILKRFGGVKRLTPVHRESNAGFSYSSHKLTDEPPGRYMYKVKELCEQNGVIFAFLNTPIYKRGECAEGAERFEAQRAQYRRHFPDVPVLDFSDCDFPKEYFQDYSHLNTDGQAEFAKVFNERLPEFLRAIGLDESLL